MPFKRSHEEQDWSQFRCCWQAPDALVEYPALHRVQIPVNGLQNELLLAKQLTSQLCLERQAPEGDNTNPVLQFLQFPVKGSQDSPTGEQRSLQEYVFWHPPYEVAT